MKRPWAVIVAVICWASVGRAQPSETANPDLGNGSSGNAQIPVTIKGTEVLSAEAVGSTSAPTPFSIEEPIKPDLYTCGSGDVFELNFWGQQNFRLKVTADLEGRLFISKVGFVPVAGKSLTAVRAAVNKKVRATYPGLNFELTLTTPRTFLVHVVDNVRRPGTATANPIERISTVIARAGGITGSKRRISIRHKNGDVSSADLVLYELTGDTSFNPFVLDGDVISVPFPETVVSVGGAVRRPGTYELVKERDLKELLFLAGGLSTNVTKSLPIRIVRRDKSEHDEFIDVPFGPKGDVTNHALLDGDAVDIRGASDLQRSVTLIGAVVGSSSVDATTTVKRLPFIEGDTVLSLIERAGGIKAPGDLRRAYISRGNASGTQEVIPVNLDALLIKRDFKEDKPVNLGDAIVVPPMQYSVLVEGAVARAGLYDYNPSFSVTEYLARAGGRSRLAKDIDDVRVVDVNGNTRGFKRGMKLSPGDSIMVPERNFSRSEVVQLAIAGASLLLSGITVAYLVTR
jgi:polysaccharide biosynthesis/export protein